MMKHIKTINRKTLAQTVPDGGCGECRTSCQSACKTSCTVANQKCENPRIAGRPGARRALGDPAAR